MHFILWSSLFLALNNTPLLGRITRVHPLTNHVLLDLRAEHESCVLKSFTILAGEIDGLGDEVSAVPQQGLGFNPLDTGKSHSGTNCNLRAAESGAAGPME